MYGLRSKRQHPYEFTCGEIETELQSYMSKNVFFILCQRKFFTAKQNRQVASVQEHKLQGFLFDINISVQQKKPLEVLM